MRVSKGGSGAPAVLARVATIDGLRPLVSGADALTGSAPVRGDRAETPFRLLLVLNWNVFPRNAPGIPITRPIPSSPH